MARRRKKNSLLPKMIGVAVLVNAILIPLLAKFGAFKGVHGQRLESVKLVNLPPPVKKPEPKKSQPKKRVAKARPHAASRVAARNTAPHPSRPNPNQPKVVVAATSGDGNGPSIDNNGTGQPGQLPTKPTVPTPAPTPAPPAVVPTPAPTSTPTPPAPALAPVPLHIPTIVAAEPLDQPHPQIPDDVSIDNIRGNFEALFTIAASGAVSVKMVSSTGDSTLDALALAAARRWTFRPATIDGKSVDSYRRLSVEFYQG